MDMELFKKRDSYEEIALWKTRRNELELLFLVKIEDLKQPGDVTKHLGKLKIAIQTEKNVFNSTLAIKNLASLANDSRRLFIHYGSEFIPVLLEKFKEKNFELTDAVHKALSAFFRISTLDVIMVENIKAALMSKSPRVKVETLCFVMFAFEEHKKIYLEVISSLLKVATDRNCRVRKFSFKALISAVDIFGCRAIQIIERGDIKLKCSTFKAVQASNEVSSFFFCKILNINLLLYNIVSM